MKLLISKMLLNAYIRLCGLEFDWFLIVRGVSLVTKQSNSCHQIQVVSFVVKFLLVFFIICTAPIREREKISEETNSDISSCERTSSFNAGYKKITAEVCMGRVKATCFSYRNIDVKRLGREQI